MAERFLAALSAQRFQAAADLTDAPPAAVALLTKVGSALRPQSVQATASALTAPAAGSTEVSETFTLSWKFASSQVWAYSNTLSVVTVDGRWRVKWSPAVIHPKLTEGTQLAVLVSATEPNAVVDRDGKPLLTWQGATARPVDPAVAPLLAGALQRTVTPQADSGGTRIALVDAAGKEVESLFGTPSAPVEPMKSTLSLRTQAAAQAAVDSAAGPAYLVAIQPSTGGILAVAQNSAAGDRPDALNGLYPPGSTFKVVTAAAVLDAGQATVDTVLPCPGTQTIGTRSIKNADFELGPVPLRTAFAESCNTTFAALAAELPPDSLSRAAAQFGLAADFEIPGLTTQTGRVRPATGTPQQVENSIGQGTVQVSPFGLALMTATVAKGSAVTPKLFTGVETVVKTGYRGPSSATVTALRAMMREVVRSGRGDALRGHGAVAGKTGTAQFGDGTQAHGWFAGYRGDLAFAVLVADAGAAAPAVTVTGKFLAAVK
ncbi:penicillin-binding transpeptidase domain-containing protein [Actinokineospora iranica]|uniref:penicillin-binding transpeptidase domain-containing protein n=1 Tax=Actinokineospora iranica TaxID=1271860 RepID=UPI001E43469B|nr:penicillin-binding transpeptidase domain-containing protein [Actinokineospora iranica]